MSAKYSFHLKSQDRKRDLPEKIIIGRNPTETLADVVLKLLAFLLFHRDRLEIEARLHLDSIPFVPGLLQLDYELRPALWVECGDCSAAKLHKLAVKAPDAEIWVVRRSLPEIEQLIESMTKQELRRDRYHLLGMEAGMFDEICELVRSRNEVFWVDGSFEPPQMQFDFNGLWFDAPFYLSKF